MNSKFAVRDGLQSGQRFLDSSAPRLIRHVASCETAGGESFPRLPVRIKSCPRVWGRAHVIRARSARSSVFT